ncbi:MAG TPA: hypothetical protein VMB82_09595 [Acidimicrobiales bacterium]|nr:hypothetical protein [Acidimicrobiales bacterium]
MTGVLAREPGPSGDGEPEPLRLRRWVHYRRDEVYEICAALALAEVLLARAGRPEEASRMAAVFGLAESGLAR